MVRPSEALQLDPRTIRQIAAVADGLDPRTVANYLRGRARSAATVAAIRRAMADLGIPDPVKP